MTVFNDALANTNAYSVISGAAPSVAANLLTVPAGSTIQFGSPSWGAINNWQVRFQYVRGLTATFMLHDTDASNSLAVQVTGSAVSLVHTVAGVAHTLACASMTLTTGTWYRMKAVQYPSAPGMPPEIAASISNDATGAIGSLVAATTLVATYDAVTALSGRSAISATGAALPIGGAYANVHAMLLFGPGAWTYGNTGSGTGVASGAWEQSAANTYAGGAVTSFAAGRIDLPPAGTVGAYLNTTSGAAGSAGYIAASTGQVIQAAISLRSTGLGAGCTQAFALNEFDVNGTYLRATVLQTVTGPQASWVKLAGSVTLGATTDSVGLSVQVTDTRAGASANGTVWVDNAQCWNQTTTGQSSMPYCELRFPQSPAQLVVTGLLGDLPAPAAVCWGSFLSSWAPGATLGYAIGRRAQASANARLAAASVGYTGTALSPTSSYGADSASYGGYKLSATMNPQWNPRGFSFTPSDLLGVYHLFSRFQTNQAAGNLGNLGNLETRVVTQQKSNPWFGTIGDADQVGAYNGPWVYPISASNTWTICDSGQVNVPALPVGALTDLTQNYLTPRTQWGDTTSGGSTGQINWQLLLPVDGSLLAGVVNNPSNGGITVSSQWLWAYYDGLLVNRAAGDAASATYSVEAAPLPNPGRGAGGPGTQTTGVINVNSAADPYLTLDPSVSVAATSTAAGGMGVNQVAGYVADNAGAVLPLHCELQYSPLYLYPR